MIMSCRAHAREHRGAVAVELALLAPVVLLLVGLFTMGYRVWAARAVTVSAAQAGARAASIAAGPDAGAQAARSTVLANLTGLGVRCAQQSIDADMAGLALPPGEVGSVRVEVTCRVDLDDLLLPGAPGSVTVRGAATERVDTFRERGS